jgi:DNA invertase Pin-like site-specific DNA recombinase
MFTKTSSAAVSDSLCAVDTSAAPGKCFLVMLGVFAEFETNLRRERQLEGIAKAKAAGVYKGRLPSIDPDEVSRLKADGFGPTEIPKALKIRRASVYRPLSMSSAPFEFCSGPFSKMFCFKQTHPTMRNRFPA